MVPMVVTPDKPTSAAFVQGFVASGLLASIQNQPGRPVADKRALRLALQGGTALAAGTSAAQAWQRRDLTRALTALALGTAGVLAIEKMMQDSKEKTDGQEEA
jgi:hypothetical protein